ncbi:Homeobox domain [Musa troglodytarum]|uniref:Homeobox domain n=1 Tax=Musa troglodytarum TaxID=320322 RepID=A0A9E7HD62_9LILI|nr:Homeobox domain [Musa troglodytarum]
MLVPLTIDKGNPGTSDDNGTIKLHRRRRRKRKKKTVERDEASCLQRRTRYLLIKIKLEQNLIDAYSGDGWNGQSREKIKPEKELLRAQKQIVKCKIGIRDAIRELDSLSCVGSIADSLMHPDGSVFHEHDIFKEATACSDVENAGLNHAEVWPSEDSEDEDYNPETNENSNSRSGIEENMSNDSSLSSLFSSSDGTISYSDSEHYSYLEKPFNIISRNKNRVDLFDSVDNYDSGPSNECAITSYRRQRRDVDYKKLHDEMFGKEPPENEAQSEDEDWGPNRRKRSKMEATTGTCMANPVNEDGSSNLALTAKISCDKKQLFRIPPDAVEKLRLAFAENELPSRSAKENLSKQLGISSEKVSKWFKNARYAALRMRKNETTNAVKNQDTSISMNESLSEDLDLPGRRVSKSFRQVSGRRMLVLERTFNKGGTGCQLDEKTDSEQLYLTEVERLCRLEDKLQSLKKTLLSCMDEDKQTTKTCVREENVIYVPVAEVKEKA